MDTTSQRRTAAWALAVGTVVGVAATAVWTVRRHRQQDFRTRDPEADRIEDQVVRALLDDESTARCAIEVASVGPGVVELTGMVATADELRRASDLSRTVDGVHTVVNRLEVDEERRRAAEARARHRAGDPALNEAHWYGQGVGTGRRRQNAQTDPERRDDRVDMITDAFEAEARKGAVEDAAVPPASGADRAM